MNTSRCAVPRTAMRRIYSCVVMRAPGRLQSGRAIIASPVKAVASRAGTPSMPNLEPPRTAQSWHELTMKGTYRMTRLTLAFSVVAWVAALASEALPHFTPAQTINLTVTAEGFRVSDGSLTEKRLHVRKGSRVRLVFHYADPNGNMHRFSLISTGTEVLARPITPTDPTASIEFTAGARGESFYRLSCE